jgi:fumarate hydratase class II
LTGIKDHLLPSLNLLQKTLREKANDFEAIRKIARTHLQDAVPMSLGQEFGGYTRQVELGILRLKGLETTLSELALGGTAVGTGLNTHPEFAKRVIAGISEETGCPFREAEDHFEAQGAQDAVVEASGVLKTIAISLMKIANDIRWLSSGPRCGLGEISIPSLQPGSSIMPGKVNPVIPEVVLQVAAQVMGNDTVITLSGQAGNFELNVMLPVMAYNLLQSIHLLDHAIIAFGERCIKGVSANIERCTSNLEQSLALVTALVPALGFETGKTIREVALEKGVMPENKINEILDGIITGKGKD